MINTLCLNESYSTTRLLTKEKPTIKNHPEDKLTSVLFLPENTERQGEGGLRKKGYFKQSYKNKPLITVVTVVFNGEEHLEETIKSVIGQAYDNVEYIIIDGGSSDGTLDIIRRYEEQIDYWVSEKDSGIYDAMNKAASLATGEWINFMNAGDSFYDNAIIRTIFDRVDYGDSAVVYGDLMNIYAQEYKVLYKAKTLDGFYQGMPFSHQSAFVKRALLLQESFDINYKICADFDFFYILYKNGSKFTYQPNTIANYNMFGASTNYLKSFQEKKKISLKNEPEKNIYYSKKKYAILKAKEIIKSILPEKIVTVIRIKLSKLYRKRDLSI